MIQIQLSEGAALNEIIVTGLGISRSEKAIPYSVQKVDGEDLAITRQINVNNALAGKVSGVQVRSQSGVNLSGMHQLEYEVLVRLMTKHLYT